MQRKPKTKFANTDSSQERIKNIPLFKTINMHVLYILAFWKNGEPNDVH